MKIHVITVCYNEEKLLPYFLKHYSFADLITVYDNHSTDKSMEIVRKFPKTEIIKMTTKDEFNDDDLLWIKNTAYKGADYDWVIIVDVDEFLYHPNLLEKLEKYKNEGVTIPVTLGFNMYSKVFPTEDKPITTLIQNGIFTKTHSKKVIFNPKVVSINYLIGAHECRPTGEVRLSSDLELYVLHYYYLSYQDFIRKRKVLTSRLSEVNLKNDWSTHNKNFAKMEELDFNRLEKVMTKII